jgi:(1->4)-alpha-D-glucan 1-alpha-D-glucosylmutase
LFVDADSCPTLIRFYREWNQDYRPFADVVYEAKRLVLQVSLSSELYVLAYQLDRLAQKHRWSRDFTLNNLRHALQQVIACFPSTARPFLRQAFTRVTA